MAQQQQQQALLLPTSNGSVAAPSNFYHSRHDERVRAVLADKKRDRQEEKRVNESLALLRHERQRADYDGPLRPEPEPLRPTWDVRVARFFAVHMFTFWKMVPFTIVTLSLIGSALDYGVPKDSALYDSSAKRAADVQTVLAFAVWLAILVISFAYAEYTVERFNISNTRLQTEHRAYISNRDVWHAKERIYQRAVNKLRNAQVLEQEE
jgi:hypothetical protein